MGRHRRQDKELVTRPTRPTRRSRCCGTTSRHIISGRRAVRKSPRRGSRKRGARGSVTWDEAGARGNGLVAARTGTCGVILTPWIYEAKNARREVQGGLSLARRCACGRDRRRARCEAGAGKWTAREIVHHLADSEMTSAVRMRNVIATDNVAIQGYDQEVFARRLYYDRPIAASLAAIKGGARNHGRLSTS